MNHWCIDPLSHITVQVCPGIAGFNQRDGLFSSTWTMLVSLDVGNRLMFDRYWTSTSDRLMFLDYVFDISGLHTSPPCAKTLKPSSAVCGNIADLNAWVARLSSVTACVLDTSVLISLTSHTNHTTSRTTRMLCCTHIRRSSIPSIRVVSRFGRLVTVSDKPCQPSLVLAHS